MDGIEKFFKKLVNGFSRWGIFAPKTLSPLSSSAISMIRSDLTGHIQALQASITSGVVGQLSAGELDDLAWLVRLTVEFSEYLKGELASPVGVDGTQYALDSVFSGVDCFLRANFVYGMLAGSAPSDVASSALRPDELPQQFRLLYSELLKPADFVRRYRVLLDLFKLQIIFAALYYD